MVMPDCSLVVTIFSRHSWLLQRMATRVTSIVAFVHEEHPVNSVYAAFVPRWVGPGQITSRFRVNGTCAILDGATDNYQKGIS